MPPRPPALFPGASSRSASSPSSPACSPLRAPARQQSWDPGASPLRAPARQRSWELGQRGALGASFSDETCPVGTEGGTRRVQIVREGGAPGSPPARSESAARAPSAAAPRAGEGVRDKGGASEGDADEPEGALDVRGLVAAMLAVGRRLNENEAQRLVSSFDTDGDGTIDFEAAPPRAVHSPGNLCFAVSLFCIL